MFTPKVGEMYINVGDINHAIRKFKILALSDKEITQVRWTRFSELTPLKEEVKNTRWRLEELNDWLEENFVLDPDYILDKKLEVLNEEII